MKEYIDVLSDNLAHRLYMLGKNIAEGKHSFDSPLRIWTNAAWNQDIIQDSALVLCIQMPDNIVKEYQNELEYKKIFDPSKHKQLLDSKSSMIYVWSKNSYIPVHADAIYSKAITIYLNKEWSYNDGGLLHWQDKESLIWNAVSPTYNKAIVNDGGILHGTTPVKSSNFRITAQTFLHPLEKNG